MPRRWRLHRPSEDQPGWRTAAALVGVFAALVALARVLEKDASGDISLWPANGVIVVSLLILRGRTSASVIAACLAINVAANLASAYSMFDSVFYSIMNLVISLITAVAMRRWCGAAVDLSRFRRMATFAVIAWVAAGLEAAAGTLVQAVVHDGKNDFDTWLQWAQCDALGLIISTPAVLLVAKRSRYVASCEAGAVEQWCLFCANLAVAWVAFSETHSPVFFLIYPLLLWTAFRAGPVWVLASVLAVALVVSAKTSNGDGPLVLLSPSGALLRQVMIQPFLASLILCALPPNNALGERNRTARRLTRLHALATSARAEAIAASAAKSQFLANMSHELRTPLNGVLGMAQALATTGLDDLQRSRLNVIQKSGGVLLDLLNDLLDFAKIEAGKLELEHTAFRVDELAQDVHDVFSATAAAKSLSFPLQISPELIGGHFFGDPTRVRQLLTNLVSNAVKFTATGEVAILIGADQDVVHVEVSDTGIGIPADRMTKLFAKFEQADASTTRRFGGTGLGLSICHDLIQLMGGELQVESVPGVGSTFRARLPLERVTSPTEARATPPATSEPLLSRGPAPLRVLAAEDNPTNQLVLNTLLDQIGAVVTTVEDGAQAIQSWRDGEFDLILMDMQMPVMDGMAATRHIRAAEAELGRDPTPIIALTADVLAHHLRNYAAAGMDGVVGKPIQFARLVQTMSDALKARTSRAPAQAA